MIINETRPIKRARRTKREMEDYKGNVLVALYDHRADLPMTIRHLFYILVTRKVIPKTETAYCNLCRNLGVWRRDGVIPFEHFVDNSRYHLAVDQWDDVTEALENTLQAYRKNLWQNQKHYVEVWTEKAAISSIVHSEAARWGVCTFACKGFASLSSLASCAETFRHHLRRERDCHVIYLGDHDPSGLHIDRKAAEDLRDQFGVTVDFQRVAVTPEQIEEHKLPTRPAKKNQLSKNWKGGCVEIDALSTRQIRLLVGESITQFINPAEWQMMQDIEKQERRTMDEFLSVWRMENE